MLEPSKTMDQVFLFISPIPKPFHHVGVHAWFVTNRAGAELSRWEVWQHRYCCPSSWGHVHKNLLPIEMGMHCSPFHFHEGKRWKGEIIGMTEGPMATKMIRYIYRYAPHYPFSHWYMIWPGPNSNTFIQWILNSFPTSGLTLPKAAKGARFSYLIF
ncbi:MAG: hypothetical protein COB67_03240 [SAR324 cluster bacterium]|uniref:Uncharacterized protein n=1 Tax=SAR324 cluster bacterium TaxID=2024889 RepID=A0A2A4T886_9DELT|nr:MAG: hypothetical protein COB67_03240 [SAR324 cluster bacterium]